MPITRREVCLLLPGAILPAAFEPNSSAAEDNALPSAFYAFEKLEARTSGGGVQTRSVLKGKLATGESIEAHETMLPPGVTPHPPHHHVHSEMLLIREGTVELTVNGASSRIGPGGVGFVRSNEEHEVKNVGDAPANYFVVAVGPTAGGA